jgi:6-phosphogluconolactonase (cycloisomerase 2 family)
LSLKKYPAHAILAAAVIAVGSIVAVQTATVPAANASRLVSVQHLAAQADEQCSWEMATPERPQWMEALQRGNAFAALQRGGGGRGEEAAGAPPNRPAITPLRTVRDTRPTYSAIAVDVNSDEVILQDNNLWSYRVFNRLDNTPAGAPETKPKRLVSGPDTALQFNNGLYVDPRNGDIYSVESDVGDKMTVFSREADGNTKPKRILHTPHRVYNVAVDETKEELYVTVEYPSEVVVYRKQAEGDEKPIRHIMGDNTQLDAPHGIVVDEKNRLLYVNTWGHHSNFKVPGTGRYTPPAIKVYSLDAKDDAPPLREIAGDRTQLNWPAAMKLNPDNGDLYVANDIGGSVLVFSNAAKAQGNVAPVRVIKGPKTKLRNPTGVFLDLKHQEVWVSNLGSASAAAFPLMANGDVAPLRMIRSAPEGTKSLNFGRTASVTYDQNREQFLVPNCVNHPQIAAFTRLSTENTPYVRSIEGQKSLLGRTMHDLAYDPVHDEIVVTSPLAQAILVFRGSANGEEAPIRVIQGPHTGIYGLGATGKVGIDATNGDIYLPTPAQDIRVWPHTANGDVPPSRIIAGPDTQIDNGRQNTGGGNVPAVRVDAVHNLLLIPSGGGNGGGAKVLVFDRTASGNARPRAVIKGPVRQGNQFEVYGPTQLMITHSRDTIEVWRIPSSGESSEPPLYRIPAPIGKASSDTGIALDPVHKEVIIASSAGNAILTFSVPEIFDRGATTTSSR